MIEEARSNPQQDRKRNPPKFDATNFGILLGFCGKKTFCQNPRRHEVKTHQNLRNQWNLAVEGSVLPAPSHATVLIHFAVIIATPRLFKETAY